MRTCQQSGARACAARRRFRTQARRTMMKVEFLKEMLDLAQRKLMTVLLARSLPTSAVEDLGVLWRELVEAMGLPVSGVIRVG